MLTLETLQETDLGATVREDSLARARRYVEWVMNPVRSGQKLSAQVRGSLLYDVEVVVEPAGLQGRCTCPYDWGGYCKHVAAVVLKWLHEPQAFAVGTTAGNCNTTVPLDVTPIDPPPSARPKELPFWMTHPLAERQRQDKEQMARWLGRIRLQDLRDMANQRGWAVRGARKSDVVQQIVVQMLAPTNLHQAARSLDSEHQQVLQALVLLFGEDAVADEDLERVANLRSPLKRHKQISTYTRHMCQLGLVLPGELKANYPPHQDFVPRAIARHLAPALVAFLPTSTNLPAIGSAGGDVLAGPGDLLRAAHEVILLLRQPPVSLRPPMPRPRLEARFPQLAQWDYVPSELVQLQQGGRMQPHADLVLTVPPPRRTLPDKVIERLAPLVDGEARLEFLYALLVAAGILQPGSPITVWQEVHAAFLRCEEPVQRAILARTFFYMLNWSELWEVLRRRPELRLKRAWRYTAYGPTELAADLWHCRQIVLRTLACLPDGKWVQWTDLVPILRAAWPRFDATLAHRVRLPGSGAWYLEQEGKPLQPADPGDWEMAQGSFVWQMIAGPLHWLGLADVSLDGEALVAFRLHGLADLYWDRVEAVMPPAPPIGQGHAVPASEVMCTEELRITVNPSAVNAQAHSLLDRIARLEIAEPGRFIYRLDAQAAYESFEQGVALSELLEGWTRFLPIPMPDPIREQLLAWWDAYGRVRIYTKLTAVEFGDDHALAEMKAVTSLEQLLVSEISPRLVLIRPEAVETLVAELEKAGYTPKQTNEV